HVLELCKRLKAMGVDVYVASNGGAYVKELTEFGITHFEIPMHNKNIYNLMLSYYELRRIIRQYRIGLVHAHARIPAFLCGLLQKKLGFRFVTTCHGVYSTELPFKILTNWGEKSLVVSEDIKKYLMDNYAVREENIIVTINGIDTEKFSPETDYASIAKEYAMDGAKKRIVFISRLDKGNCVVAHKLLECAEVIYSLNKKLEIFIVGNGTEYGDIRQKAVDMNKRLGKKLVYMAGARTDVNKFVASADIVIAISRAALEAMSAEKPVILAGNPGYIGIFEEPKLETAVETNFCCRGCAAVETETLRKDILKLLQMKPEELRQIGVFGREVVKKHYSVQNMAENALALYEGVLKPRKETDVVISGYYGFHNHGDDAVLKAIIDDLKALKPGIKITVLSKRPKDTAREYNVNAVYRLNFFKIGRIFRNTTLLISGGGSLIQDLTSTQSLIYYLYIINAARDRHARVMLYANGIGPVRRERNKIRARRTLNRVDLITLRDDASREVLKTLGIKMPPVALTADAAFGIKNSDTGSAEKLLSSIGLENKKYFCVAIRNWKYLQDGFEKEIALCCEYIYLKHNLVPLFIPMQPATDAEISKRIAASIKTGAYYTGSDYSINEMLGIIEKAEFVLAMRLHAIIYAAKTGTPVIGLVYDPKVQAMMERFKQEYYCDVKNLDPEQLRHYADYVVVNRGLISRSLKELSGEAEENAMLNAKMAVSLLEADCF
ncbi:MAG: polysaccharide pyruvyl transferase CsaB, partial [Clostridiales bacterium]|nr:polysaccharide pyruvyl transferase CsaB [Clostridiales bacterium]